MEKEFIPYEQALELKELGFDEPCFGIYQKNKKVNIGKVGRPAEFPKNSTCWNCSAPTFSQAFRWFREKYGLHIVIENMIKNNNDIFYFLIKNMKNHIFIDHSIQVNGFDYKTPEEAELECLKKLIEIVKEK